MTTAEVWIPLTQGKVTVIDFDDFEKVRNYKWHADRGSRTWYVKRNAPCGPRKQRQVKLHRELMQPPVGLDVDHIDGDGLNNRRSNLRLATTIQNGHNRTKQKGCSSAFKGVCLYKRNTKWGAGIRVNGLQIYLGVFVCEEDAARAYDVAAIKYFGEYARLNFPITQ